MDSAFDNLLIIPHEQVSDVDCCGCLMVQERGDQADILCNECGAVVRTVPTGELQKTFDEMELTLEVASEICPHCETANLFPGFSRMLAFTCKSCGEAVGLWSPG